MHNLTRSRLTVPGLLHGFRICVAAFPGYIVFGMAFGTAAAQKGLTFGQCLSLSAFVYAGASQMVALEIWQQVWSLGTLLTVVTVTAVVNARFILLGATLQPWFATDYKWRSILNLFLLTEANWLLGSRYYYEGGRDIGVLLGSGILLWIVWVAATAVGYFAGALVPDPNRFGLDLVMPIFFCTMLVPLWKGARPALPWLVAALVAIAVHLTMTGYLFIIAGALAGVAAAIVIG
jgi:4-azaleucine resistance transporter AzlC